MDKVGVWHKMWRVQYVDEPAAPSYDGNDDDVEIRGARMSRVCLGDGMGRTLCTQHA